MKPNLFDDFEQRLSVWEQIEQEFACEHKTHLVRYSTRGGARLVEQCKRCGEYIGGFRKQVGVDMDALPWFDEELRVRCRERKSHRRTMLYEQSREDYVQTQQEQQEEWRRQYNEYLNSRDWLQLRLRVLGRDDYVCQNCFCDVTAKTAHVHHISYDGYRRTGHSFAFECVTLCQKCHTDFHPHMQPVKLKFNHV